MTRQQVIETVQEQIHFLNGLSFSADMENEQKMRIWDRVRHLEANLQDLMWNEVEG